MKIRIITEDTEIAWVDGKPIVASHLQRWAYNQLSITPELVEILKTCRRYIYDVSKRTLGDHLDNFADYDLLDKVECIIKRANS